MKTQLLKLVFGSALLVLASSTAFAAHLGDKLTFSARMNGAQEVPAVTTNGQGVATFTLNGMRDSLCISIYMGGTSDAVTGIHLHNGLAGTTGAVALDLSSYLVNGNVMAVITGADLTSSLISDMITGNIYVNAHTALNPNGEIRGQVKLETDFPYRATLNGASEVPPVITTATGQAAINLSLDKKTLMFWVTTEGLSGAMGGAHLHYGTALQAGPVAVDLSAGIMGNSIVGTVDVSMMPELYDSLVANKVYINVHTAANPAGEIRGQLAFDNQIAFDGYLTGSAEVPASASAATGTAQFSLNSTFTAINYSVQVEGLSGAIGGAHLHTGVAGTSGAVIVDLSGDVVGNTISGTISGTDLTDELIIELLESGIYLNVHTTAYPNGEIRAQINRVAREGYSVNLSGDQEVPGVSTNANGGGIVTISRERNNAHIMLVVKDLSGPITGSHIHNAAAGANGSVEFDLTPWFAGTGTTDGAYGYWSTADMPAMGTASEVKFRNNEMYVNVHTAANANGEVRGQIIRGSECMQTVLGIEEAQENNLSVFPNPTNSILNVISENLTGNIIVTDVLGKRLQDVEVTGVNTTIDFTNLPNGVYMILNGTNTVRVIKN